MRGIIHGTVEQRFNETFDQRQRSAELVTHVRNKVSPRSLHLLESRHVMQHDQISLIARQTTPVRLENTGRRIPKDNLHADNHPRRLKFQSEQLDVLALQTRGQWLPFEMRGDVHKPTECEIGHLDVQRVVQNRDTFQHAVKNGLSANVLTLGFRTMPLLGQHLEPLHLIQQIHRLSVAPPPSPVNERSDNHRKTRKSGPHSREHAEPEAH